MTISYNRMTIHDLYFWRALCHVGDMVIPAPHKPGPKKKPPIVPKQVQGVKYLRNFRELLGPLEAHRNCPNRDLHYDDYVAYELLYFFTPVLTSMRGLQQASNFQTVQRKLGLPRFSLGAFSEAGRVFDPKALWPILQHLSQEVAALQVNPRFPYLDRRPTIVDGSLLHALPRMLWALWVDDEHRAAKVHLEYDLLAEAPAFATVTDGQGNERTVLRGRLASGKLYLLDLDADLVAELYRYRWEVELFFRWFKKVLQVEHLLSHNRNGLTIMVYCALIAMLLVRLWTGRKPTKRTYEMVCFYFLGWVSEDELAAHIASLALAQS